MPLISEFSIFHLRMRQLGVIRDKQAFSAAEVAREEYFFCGPSPGMFLFIPCLSRMTSEISLCSLRDSELPYSQGIFLLLSKNTWNQYSPFDYKSSCGRQKGPSMMTRYARSYSLQMGPSIEDSVE